MASDEWDVSYVNTKHFKRPGVYLSKMTLFPKLERIVEQLFLISAQNLLSSVRNMLLSVNMQTGQCNALLMKNWKELFIKH